MLPSQQPANSLGKRKPVIIPEWRVWVAISIPIWFNPSMVIATWADDSGWPRMTFRKSLHQLYVVEWKAILRMNKWAAIIGIALAIFIGPH
jgi:hypothetical protein